MKRKWVIVFFWVVFFVAVDGLIRLGCPFLAVNGHTPAQENDSPFLYDASIGFEVRPFAPMEVLGEIERMNQEGFRGPDTPVAKPADVYRIVALGDSVVQGLSVARDETWETFLEEKLNSENQSSSELRRYEIINAGVGGYLSWQALARYKNRAMKYNPDLVLVLVGWNDMLISSLPHWSPAMEWSGINRSRQASHATEAVLSQKSTWKHIVYRYSGIARLARWVRNQWWNWNNEKKIISSHQKDSGIPLNQTALALYEANLQAIHDVIVSSGAKMTLITWPTILSEDSIRNQALQKKIVNIYYNFPLSGRELWEWYSVYHEAQINFCLKNQDVLLIDAAREFAAQPLDAQMSLFSDFGHLTAQGNQALAQVIWKYFHAR